MDCRLFKGAGQDTKVGVLLQNGQNFRFFGGKRACEILKTPLQTVILILYGECLPIKRPQCTAKKILPDEKFIGPASRIGLPVMAQTFLRGSPVPRYESSFAAALYAYFVAKGRSFILFRKR